MGAQKSLDDAERGAGEVLLESLDVGKGFEHGERVAGSRRNGAPINGLATG